jgi:hypothetical protein
VNHGTKPVHESTMDSGRCRHLSLPELPHSATPVDGGSSRQRENREGSGRILTEVETGRCGDGYGQATVNGGGGDLSSSVGRLGCRGSKLVAEMSCGRGGESFYRVGDRGGVRSRE